MPSLIDVMMQNDCTMGEASRILAERRAAKKAEREALAVAVTTSPVALAVEPLKQDAIDAATKWAAEQIEHVRTLLEAAGWNIEAVAPRGDSLRDGRTAYRTKEARRAAFESVTTRRDKATSYRPGKRHEPLFVVMDAERCAHFTVAAQKSAAAQYEAFVAKLVSKIGECKTAKLDGNHVWSHSVLTITKNGTTEKWKTKQITNVSKLGKYFPQWPSRIVK